MVVEQQKERMRLKMLQARPVPRDGGGVAEVVSRLPPLLAVEVAADGALAGGVDSFPHSDVWNGKPNGAHARDEPKGEPDGRQIEKTNLAPAADSSLLATWSSIPLAPADPILKAQTYLLADTSPLKLDLSVGAYRDASGAPSTLRCVELAQSALSHEPTSHAYLPLAGDAAFVRLSTALVFGASVAPSSVAAIQTVSGSGALRLALGLCREHLGARTALLPAPTWPNHHALARAGGLSVREYAYYDAGARKLRLPRMLADLARAPRGSVVVLHACGHNPTGADVPADAWGAVADAVRARGLIPLFDAAYLGLASGCVEEDAGAVRLFARRGIPTLVALSFSKALGLYNGRVGALMAALPGAGEGVAGRTRSQMVAGARAMYSSPPAQGARVAARVMADARMRGVWEGELREMAARMRRMRMRLAEELGKRDGGAWGFVAEGKRGMFVLLGMDEGEVKALRERWHVYVAPGGRLNVSGLTEENVGRVAEAIVDVGKGGSDLSC